MRKGNFKAWVFLLLIAFVFMSGGCGGSSDDGSFSFTGGSGTSADPWQIATAGQLDEARNHLGGHFVLTSDIDLSSYSNWEPIGAFVPISDKPEDGETPTLDLAFTGVFDGGGHKISNVRVSKPEVAGVGLFGCTADSASISNLTVENINVAGTMLVGGVVGYAAEGTVVENVKLVGTNNIEGSSGIEGSMVGMVGGIVGGGFCDIIDCEAQANARLVADFDLGQLSQCVGVLAGGMEDCDITGSSAKGSVFVDGEYIAGIGGLAGCALGSEKIQNCASDVVITVRGSNMLVGGLLGYSGISSEGSEQTLISDCIVSADIDTQNSERVGGIVGGGFYMQAYAPYFPIPSAIHVTNCQTSGEINGGSIAGSILGYAYNNSSVEGCTSDMKVNGAAAEQIGATLDDVTLDDLR
jgi:hypothetical protein